MRIEPHHTRLFPKFLGAQAYRLTGIAARCDWVLLSDIRPPHVHLVRRDGAPPSPRHVFVSMRAPFAALAALAEQVLPRLNEPFVLVTGSQDVTLPNQRDHRWRPYSDAEHRCFQDVLAHPQLCRWFVENLDEKRHPKMSPLPVGLVFPDGPPADGVVVPEVPPLATRPPRILCAHRDRVGPQWELRRQVTAIARSHWAGWCTVLDEEVSEAQFLALVEQHAFVLCIEGGGLDPSPKAWQAVLHGAVPVVRDSPLREAYAQLPVAFVPDWTPDSIHPGQLARWQAEAAPRQDDPGERRETVRRLGLDYWWAEVAAALSRGP
jgi:hypothetical protein